MAVHRSAEYWSLGIDFLAAGNYIAVNRSLIKVFGLEGAVLIGELASEAKYWNDRDKLEDGWFFSTIENVEEATGLSGYQQRKALMELTKAGVLETTQKGIPKKRYVRIHFMELVNLVNDKSLKNFTTVGEETSPLEGEKLDINNYNEQLEQTTTRTSGNTHAKKKRQPFKEPTLEEVTAYCQERKNSVDPQAFIAYYQTRGWELKGGAKMKDWKASVRYWERTEKKYSGGDPTDRRSQYTEEQNKEFDEYAWNPDQIERI